MKRSGLKGLLLALKEVPYSETAQVATVIAMIVKDCPGLTSQLINGEVAPRLQGAALTLLAGRVAAPLVGLSGDATGRSAS